jgi:signal transduction histidine kinase
MKRKAFFYLIMSVLLMFNVVKLYSQQTDQFTINRYTSQNGLPQNSIKSMVMDDRRYIWMTTEGGLVRYDGQRFKIYNKNYQESVGNDRFRWIIKTSSGELLTDDLSGKSFLLNNGSFEPIKGLPQNILAAPQLRGRIPDRQLYLKIKSRKLPFFLTDSVPDSPYIIIDKSGPGYYVKYQNGLLEYNDDDVLIRKHHLTRNSPINLFEFKNQILYFDRNNQLYLYRPVKGSSEKILIKGDISATDINKLKEFKNVVWSSGYPEVYFNVDMQLFELKLDTVTKSLSTKLIINNLPDNCSITDVINDEESACFFIGTDTKGFYVYKRQQFKTLINSGELKNSGNSFYSQAAIDSHRVYAGYNREASINGIVKSDMNIGNNQLEALYTSAENKMYYSIGDELLNFNIKTGEKKTISHSKNNKYYVFYEEGDSIIIGSQQYIGYIKKDKLFLLYNLNDLSAEYKTEDIIRGPDGMLWIATCKGVFRLDEIQKKLIPVSGLSHLCARTFMIDGKKIYIGTYGQGFYSWEDGNITVFPVDKNKYLNHVHSFYTDSGGRIWFSTNNGILKASWKLIQNFTNEQKGNISYYYYGEEDGIINTEFNGGCSPAYVALKNGYVSYPSMEGLVWFKPNEIKHNLPVGIPVIDEIQVNGKNVSSADRVSVPPSSESVIISLSLPYYGKSDNINLQYKLEGLNKDWVTISPEEMKISFTNLTSGTHRLQIRNLSEDQSNLDSQMAIVFDVEKRYYETLWFRLLTGFFMIFILYMIFKLNNSRILRKNLALENKISLRTAELQDANRKLTENLGKLEKQEVELKESIQLKNRLISVISHDIITPLKFISMVSRHSKRGITDSESHIKTMQDIEFASERLHNNASNILNWIKVQNQNIVTDKIHIALHELADECMEPIKGMASLKNIKLINNIPEETIIRSDKNILSIILQNLLTNSVKYTELGSIEITSQEKDDCVLIKVTDTGVGMTEGTLSFIRNIIAGKNSAVKPEENIDIGNRLGYYIIADLLKYLDGTAEVSSNHGKGTQVTLYLK